MTERRRNTRIVASGLFFLAAMTGLGFRLAFLHLGPHEEMRARLTRLQSFEKRIMARRGQIFDRNGTQNILALNLAVHDVCADPQFLHKSNCVEKVASVLADCLDMPERDVARRLVREDSQFAYISRYVSEEKANEIRDKGLPGVFFRNVTVRHYPQQDLMSHVLGFVNYEAVGSAGIEQLLDAHLKGSPGLLEGEVNGLRKEVYGRRNRSVPAMAGSDVSLTLDQHIQYIVEKEVEAVVEDHNAKGAWIVVQDVRTGQILAMGSRPDFDPNRFRKTEDNQRLNRAIGYVYEPGSTLKVATFASALNEKTVRPQDVYHCENGQWRHGSRLLHDYHPYGLLTVADGLKKSSNILAAKVALTLGKERQYRYLREFGLGRRSGVDLPGEEAGILHPPKRWSDVSATRIAIGQGVAVTALQMLGIVSSIANDGFLMRPYVVQRVCGPDGKVLIEKRPEVLSRPLTAETAATMRELLHRVTESGGTGRAARVEGYEVAGKTGTAQKAINGQYSGSAHMASFVGFLPVDRPRIAMIVVVDEPQPYHTGGKVAAPVFGKIATEIVRYLDIPPADYELVAAARDR